MIDGPVPAVDAVRRRLDALQQRISERSSHPVSIVAVTKAFPPELIGIAVAAGCTAIGENYGQELFAKAAAVDAASPRPDVHFIGRLQRNKVKAIASIVDVWDSLDRESVVAEVAKRAPAARVLIQVDTGSEEGKGGCAAADTPALVATAVGLGLRVEGLMTVAPTAGGPEAARPGFAAVRRLVDDLGLVECSMGMTADLDVALDEGTTQVRVGSLLFGHRRGP